MCKHQNSNLVLCGDFNLNTDSDNDFITRYKSIILSNGFNIVNTSLTRLSETNTLIDHVITNINLEISVHTFPFTISDHNAIICQIDLEKPENYSERIVKVIDYMKIKCHLAQNLKNNITDYETFTNIVAASVLENTKIKKYLNKSTPLNSPWITDSYKNLIKQKSKLLWKRRRKPHNTNITYDLLNIQSLINKSKKELVSNFYNKQLQSSSNPKDLEIHEYLYNVYTTKQYQINLKH